MLSAFFFLLAVLAYHVVVDQPSPLGAGGGRSTTSTKTACFALTIFLSICSMLSKETGLTALGVCVALEIISALQGIGLGSVAAKSRAFTNGAIRSAVLMAFAIALTAVRVGWTGKPTLFNAADNQAAFHPVAKTRLLSFNHLYAFNLKLLAFPRTLCYDWNGDAIPLVHEFSDPRLILPIVMYIVLFTVGIKGIIGTATSDKRRSLSNTALVGMALLVIPFIPTTGIFFTVGFTVAERVLYIPSIGFCIVAGVGVQLLKDKVTSKTGIFGTALAVALLAIVALLFAKTYARNPVWTDSITLTEAAIESCPGNAKSHYNYAHFLSNQGNPKQVDIMYHYIKAQAMDGTDPTYVSPLALAKARAGDVIGALPLFELAVEICEQHRKPRRRVDPYLNLLVTYRNLNSKPASLVVLHVLTLLQLHQCTAKLLRWY
jgi:hypothetical protein